jgi:hypothetical protein
MRPHDGVCVVNLARTVYNMAIYSLAHPLDQTRLTCVARHAIRSRRQWVQPSPYMDMGQPSDSRAQSTGCSLSACMCWGWGAVCTFASKSRRLYRHQTLRQEPCTRHAYIQKSNALTCSAPVSAWEKSGKSFNHVHCRKLSNPICLYAHVPEFSSFSDMLISILNPQNFKYKHFFLPMLLNICL